MTTTRLEQTLSLLDLPSDILKFEIYPKLSVKDIGLFALTSKIAFNKIKDNINDRLLHDVAFASPVAIDQNDKSKLAAEIILRLYPEILFEKALVVDPVGRKVHGSAYQVAWGAGDIWMLKMMHEIIKRISSGAAIAKVQYEEQFPSNDRSRLDTINREQIKQIAEDLKAVAAAISDDPCTDGKATKQKTIDAINSLITHLAPQKNQIIRSGMHFPPQILKEIHAVYYQHLSPWSVDQLRLYTSEVICFVVWFSTAVDAQRYAIHADHYDNEESPPNRTTRYFDDVGVRSRMPNTYLVTVYGHNKYLHDCAHLGNFGMFKKLCQAKEFIFDELCHDIDIDSPIKSPKF